MKKIITLGFICWFAINGFSQRTAIKGRAFGVPGINLFTLGFGFERMLNEDISVQLLFNRMGYDMRDTDGGAEFVNFVVPEVRYYLGEKENKNIFLGVFTEFSKTNYASSGYPPDTILATTKIFKDEAKNTISPGALIGVTNGTKKPFLFEFYLGGKYRLANVTKEYILNQEDVIEKRNTKKLGVRIGINIGYRF